VRLFGDCRITIGDRTVPSVPNGFFRLAAYVLLEGHGRPVSRRRIGQLLWSEQTSLQANADIRQTIARIRRVQQANGFRFLANDSTLLWLIRDDEVSCDLADFLDAAEDPSEAAATAMLAIQSGDLLGSLPAAGEGFEEWLANQRVALDRVFVETLTRAVTAESALPRLQRDACARKLVDLDPCHEGAYRALMRTAGEAGDLVTLRHLYAECTRALLREIGERPEAETVNLYKSFSQRLVSPGDLAV
jgi:DNA-binding SARP family transcriptional activator